MFYPMIFNKLVIRRTALAALCAISFFNPAYADGINSASGVDLPLGAGGNTYMQIIPSAGSTPASVQFGDFSNGGTSNVSITPGTGDFSFQGILKTQGRIFSGDQIKGGTGGMWVGPNQFVGSMNGTELGFYNNGVWDFAVRNDNWIMFGAGGNNGSLANWVPGNGYNYTTLGTNFQQQLVLSSDNNAYFFPWTAPATVNVNGNINVYTNNGADNNNPGIVVNGQFLDATTVLIANTLKGCSDGQTVVKNSASASGYSCASAGGNGISFYFPFDNYVNPLTGGLSCPAGTTDRLLATLWYGGMGWQNLHVCTPY